VHLIKLKDVASCAVVSSGKEVRNNEGRRTNEDYSKDLSISLNLNNRSVIDLPIYNEMLDGPLDRPPLMKLARVWERRITSLSGRVMQRA
jgi:hypothetical protein